MPCTPTAVVMNTVVWRPGWHLRRPQTGPVSNARATTVSAFRRPRAFVCVARPVKYLTTTRPRPVIAAMPRNITRKPWPMARGGPATPI